MADRRGRKRAARAAAQAREARITAALDRKAVAKAAPPTEAEPDVGLVLSVIPGTVPEAGRVIKGEVLGYWIAALVQSHRIGDHGGVFVTINNREFRLKYDAAVVE
jgi:hypothetical protein